jgi:SAM-dependent methyltransferase
LVIAAAGRPDSAHLESARRAIAPPPELETRIKAFIATELGGVLPRSPDRGLDHYYTTVVLGTRAVDAFRVLAAHAPSTGLPLVDVGAGLGSFVLLSLLLDRPAVGVEPGAAELALAQARAVSLGLPPESFRRGTGEELPVPRAGAGAVLLQDVLEHVRDWRAVLAQAVRALAPGGALYVKGPSYGVRFFEPHYRVPWIPMLPRPLATRYLRALGRDPEYLRHIGFIRRGEVLRELRSLGLELFFPRVSKLGQPELISRAWARRLAALATRARVPSVIARGLAESPLQSAIDVVAVKPNSGTS